MKNPHILTLVLAALCLITSCQKINTDNDGGLDVPYVRVVFGFAGLGDRCYNDVIYSGVWTSKLHYGEGKVNIDTCYPQDMEETETIIGEWYDKQMSGRKLLILCAPNFDTIFDKHPEWKSTNGREIFILDCKRTDLDLYAWYISLYGVSHLAGQTIKTMGNDSLAVVLANNKDINIAEALDGMTAGYIFAGGKITKDDIYYISNEQGQGYNSADSLYRLSAQLDQKGYDFVSPIAGGTALGLYRYTRLSNSMNPEGMFAVCGYDIDHQDYSQRVAFSVIKRVDLAISEFIDNWLAGKEQLRYRYLGLDSKFVDILVSDAFSSTYNLPKEQYESLKQSSIDAEQEYKLSHAEVH